MSELYHESAQNASEAFEWPGYYAIIPANVRYDDKLPPNAKLLYGEITALTNQQGFCYASNAYFCKLYGFSDPTITRLLKALEDGGFIRREIERDKARQVDRRKIWLATSVAHAHPPINFEGTLPSKLMGPPLKIDGENITGEYSLSLGRGKGKSSPDKLEDTAFAALVAAKTAELAAAKGFDPEQRERIRGLAAEWYAPRTVTSGSLPIHTERSVNRLFSKLGKADSFGKIADALEEAMSRGWTSIPDRLLGLEEKKGKGRAAPKPKPSGGELGEEWT